MKLNIHVDVLHLLIRLINQWFDSCFMNEFQHRDSINEKKKRCFSSYEVIHEMHYYIN